MIKLKEILKETYTRSKDVNYSKIGKLMNGAFSEAYYRTDSMKGYDVGPLFRAIRRPPDSPYKIINPSKHTRTSMTSNDFGTVGTSNFHTALIDILPSWKNYPKRSKSVIFSNSRSDIMALYGTNVFYVIPKNSARICVSPQSDFWTSIIKINDRLYDSISGFNTLISQFFTVLRDDGLIEKTYNFYTLTPEEIKHLFSMAEKLSLKEMLDSLRGESMTRLFDDLERNYKGSFLEYFDKLFDPEDNGFVIKSVGESFGYDRAREMFTEDICLLIHEEAFPWK